MDWQKLKERVTEEVIRQLSASGGAASEEAVKAAVAAVVATPGASPAGAAGSVASAPSAAPAGASAPATASVAASAVVAAPVPVCAVPDGFKTDVLVVLAGSDEGAPFVRSLTEAGMKVTVVASKDARTAGVPADLAACHIDGGMPVIEKLIGAAKVLAVPTLSLGAASAVASLSSSCMACQAIIHGVATGKKVVVLRPGLQAPAGAPWSVRRKVEELETQLKSYGIVFAEQYRFVNEVVKAAGGQPTYKYGGGGATMGSAGRAAISEAVRPSGQGGFVPAWKKGLETPAGSPTGATGSAVATASKDWDRDLAKMIDHTLLKPEATAEQVIKLCKEAVEYGFWSVCVNPTWVPLCAKELKGTPVKVCTVIGFPLGATSSTAKALEAADVIQKGATEVDMVLNVGALKSKQYDLVLNDMKAVAQVSKGKALVKVILETGLLTDEEKVKACELAKEAGLEYVKTSTGFGPGGATPADIALMRKTVGPEMGVKASGGIRDYDAAIAVVKSGASRIGASASINIVKRVKADPKAGGKY